MSGPSDAIVVADPAAVELAASELDNGVIKPDEFEVLRLDDDPSFPERGKLVLSMAGGR